jgi:hypothetical protein
MLKLLELTFQAGIAPRILAAAVDRTGIRSVVSCKVPLLSVALLLLLSVRLYTATSKLSVLGGSVMITAATCAAKLIHSGVACPLRSAAKPCLMYGRSSNYIHKKIGAIMVNTGANTSKQNSKMQQQNIATILSCTQRITAALQ